MCNIVDIRQNHKNMSDCKQSWDDPKFDPVARKKDHEKKHGRDSQERKPREECPECGEEIYLKWGPIRTHPYWSHNRAIDTPGAPGACGWQPRIQYPESEEHIKGKQIACDLLNRGLLKIETRCSECGAHEITGPPQMVYRTEVSDTRRGACRWDVAGLNALEEVVVGVEIKHSHETDRRLERSHVWWAELSASDLLWHEDIDEDDDEPVTVRNRRVGQICFVSGDCKTRVAEKLRAEKEEVERKRVEQERLIKEREEKTQKRLDWARRWGYIDKESRFTDLVHLTDTVKGEIEKFPLCIRCGEDRGNDFKTPFCIDCRHEVTEYDRKNKLEQFGRTAGIFDGRFWTLPPPDWRSVLKKTKECEEFWEKIFRVVKICAMCQKRRGYRVFPYCEACCEDVKNITKKETISVQSVQPPSTKKLKYTEEKDEDKPKTQQTSGHIASTLDPLSLFMGNRDYGPSLGITPTRRYLRAKLLECPMSAEIVDFFEKAIEEENKTKK